MAKPVEEPPTYAKIPDRTLASGKTPVPMPKKTAPKAKAAAARKQNSTVDAPPDDAVLESEGLVPDRRESIAVAAYHLAERRGFAPNHDVDDWLQAEAEVMASERAG